VGGWHNYLTGVLPFALNEIIDFVMVPALGGAKSQTIMIHI
jgi:hypothetical protein